MSERDIELEHRLTRIETKLDDIERLMRELQINVKAQSENAYRISRISLYISVASLSAVISLIVALILK